MMKHKKYTKDEIISLLKEYVASGMSHRRFCLERGINYYTFKNWRKAHDVPSPYKNYKSMMKDEAKSSDESIQRELEQLRREKKQLEMELQRTKWKLEASELMIDLAESTYHIKVRKNSGAK